MYLIQRNTFPETRMRCCQRQNNTIETAIQKNTYGIPIHWDTTEIHVCIYIHILYIYIYVNKVLTHANMWLAFEDAI